MSKLTFFPKNKKAFSLSSWTEVALFTTLFILLFVGLIVSMNVQYNQNVQMTNDGNALAGFVNTSYSKLNGYQDTMKTALSNGTATSSGLGLSFSQTWNIISTGATIIWDFITGGTVKQLIVMIGFPDYVGNIFQVLFVLSIGYIAIKLILKVAT